MFKKISIVLISGLFILGISNLSFAMMCGDTEHEGHTQVAQASGSGHVHEAMPEIKPSSGESVSVGNKICPVMGEKIDEKTKATYEYEGKIYNFCCPACIDEFKKDPEKYIKKVEEELKNNSTQSDMPESTTNAKAPAPTDMHSHMQEGHSH